MRVSATLYLVTVCLALSKSCASQRIIGGSVTTISQYPAIAALLYSDDLSTYSQKCGGSILNTRSILTAANCIDAASFNIHPNYDSWTQDSDIAILQTATSITYVNNAVQPALIAGTNYIPGDEEEVWAAGWGATEVGGSSSEQLRHVQTWTINQATCRSRYASVSWPITDNMLCSGYLDVGGQGQCQGDAGSPLYHNNVVVGVYSWSYQCALPYYPGVNTRVSSFSVWIQQNA